VTGVQTCALPISSITGDLLICEYSGEADNNIDFFPAFALRESQCIPIETTTQRFGKIAPIDDQWRKKFIFGLSTKNNIFSLGRFGTWRNILLDSVLNDITVIKKLMASTHYDRATHNSR
jgi:hypothetical protein